jgi:hypothetical protein
VVSFYKEQNMATLSGQTAVATAGTAVQLAADQLINGPVMVKALPGNTDLVYIGNVAGDVASTNGLPLAAGEMVILGQVGNLSSIWVDSAVNGEGVAWIALNC